MKKEIQTVGGLPCPVFYPSVSSVSKNVWNILDHIDLLVSVNHPQFLVSAFDIYKYKNNKRLLRALELAEDQNQVILYDSGIYEVVWSKSKRWCKKRYIRTLKSNRFSNAFDYDDYVLGDSVSASAASINKSVNNVQSQLGSTAISPIIHCRDINEYVDICVSVSNTCKPRLLAIPERELGSGMLSIANNIKKIREALNQLEYYQPLHILGTGNPLSMMVYAFVGADSFDGLDWCQTVVDYESATLHHPLHLDLYKEQSQWGAETEMDFLARCYLHNLEFYTAWMEKIQGMSAISDKQSMLDKYLPTSASIDFIKLLNIEQDSGEKLDETMANQ